MKNESFQDQLFTLFQIFWKAGYHYRHNKEGVDQKDQNFFYAKLLEDLMTLPQEEFIIKYKFYDN